MERLKLYFHGRAVLTIWSEGKNREQRCRYSFPTDRRINNVSDYAGG